MTSLAFSGLSVRLKLLSAFLSLAVIGGVTGLVGALNSNQVGSEGIHVAERLAPLADAAMEIKLTATAAHLIFEEIMAGDAGEDIEVVWSLLDETRFYADAILNGGENQEGTFYASDDPKVRAKVESVLVQVDDFIAAARERHAGLADRQGVGTDADVKFDALYDRLLADIDTLASEPALFTDANAQRAAGGAKYLLANGHLLVEEALGGDEGEDFAEATKNFAAAIALLEGLGANTGDIGRRIEEFSALASERFEKSKTTLAAGSNADQIFDEKFDGFILSADEAETLIHGSMERSVEHLKAANRNGMWLMSGLAATSFILAAVLAAIISRNVSGRLTYLSGAMAQLADGNLSVDIRFSGDRDEIGQMAGNVETFKANAVRAKEFDAERAREQAQKEQRSQQIDALCRSFDTTASTRLSSVEASSTDVRDTAGTMTRNAAETAEKTNAISASAEHASSNVQTAATGAEELSASIGEISRQVSQSSEFAGEAVEETNRITERVRGLDEAAQKIGNVVSLISEIAEQTNLLALNATIEAARAGEAGKGFAVVASEVKSLATQTAKATEEIASQVGGMQSATGSAVNAIDGIRDIISKISESTSAISAAVEEQNAATNEIARNVQAAADGTGEVTVNIEEVDRSARSTDELANKVLTASEKLTAESEALKSEVSQFLKEIAAV